MRADRSRRRASFTLRNRMERALWIAVRATVFRSTPKAANAVRIALLKLFGARVAWTSRISATAVVWLPRNLVMGCGAAVGPGVDLYNMGPMTIGDRAVVSQRVFLCGGTHDVDDPAFPLAARPIVIGPDSWVAAEAMIGPGAVVGEGAVIAARAVLFGRAEPWTVHVGNPARFLRQRERAGR